MPERAIAYIHGSRDCPGLKGKSQFTSVEGGTVVDIEVHGLPSSPRPDGVPVGTHGLCFHEAPVVNSPYDEGPAFGIPCRMGQLPALFSREGSVAMYYYTDKFTVDDLIGLGLGIHCEICPGAMGGLLGGGIIRAVLG